MSRRFHRGLVVGKFAPLHRGRGLLIDQAREACDDVLILSYSKPEFPGSFPDERRSWLAALYPTLTSLVVDDAWLAELSPTGFPFKRLPENSDGADVHRRFCAALCQAAGGPLPDAVFTSESYGAGFARTLAGGTKGSRHRPGPISCGPHGAGSPPCPWASEFFESH